MPRTLIELAIEMSIRLFLNPGWFPKGDREEQHGNRHCQDQNVSNAFHKTKILKLAVLLIVYQELGG